MYTCTLDGVGGQCHAPAAFPPEKKLYQLYRRLGGPHGRSERVRKISPQPGFDPRTVRPVQGQIIIYFSCILVLYSSCMYLNEDI
jgi:hypothetical protein